MIQLLMLHYKVNMSRVISFMWFLSFPGMYQDVQGQLSNEKALAYPRAPCARLCRVWQSLCREFKTEEASTRTHGRETFPGEFFHMLHFLFPSSGVSCMILLCFISGRKRKWSLKCKLFCTNLAIVVSNACRCRVSVYL